MFSILIVTNKETDSIDKTIDILYKTISKLDEIVLINYNTSHLKYRSDRRVVYVHHKTHKWGAISKVVKSRSSDIVLFDMDIHVNINFINNLKKYYNKNAFGVFKLNDISKDGKRAINDKRVGSKITMDDVSSLSVCFNRSIIKDTNSFDDIKQFIINNKIKVLLYNKIVTYKTTIVHKPNIDDFTVIVPSTSYKYQDQIQALLNVKEVRTINFDQHLFTKYINNTIPRSEGKYVIVINPKSEIYQDDIIDMISSIIKKGDVVLCDHQDNITNNSWVVLERSAYKTPNNNFRTVNEFHRYMLTLGNIHHLDIGFHEVESVMPKIPNHIEYSIIIPFMYNGDRYDIFKSSLECLHKHTSQYNNIEIIVHETSPKQYLTKSFIKRYGIVYQYSKWDKLFHRAWALNVPARHIAKGDTFIFFDADLLIDDKWIRELFECDKTISYIGWGKMINLNKKSTDHYNKTSTILKNEVERVRVPRDIGAVAGINIIPKEDFFCFGGWPEDYNGLGYGGEDNSMFFKMKSLGFYGDI